MIQSRQLTRHRNRRLTRTHVRVSWRAPDELAQALMAFRRASRAHRRLAQLAPSFFDSAVVDRERQNREAKQRWMESWEPLLARVYGEPPQPVDLSQDDPRLPGKQTRLAVERRLAEWRLWMEAGRAAMTRWQQRNPNALPSLTRLAGLLDVAFQFKALALGLNSPNRIPDTITYDDEFTGLQRAYGNRVQEDQPVGVGEKAPTPAPAPVATPASVPEQAIQPQRCDAWSRWARQRHQAKR